MFQHLVRESFIIGTFLTTVSKPSFTSRRFGKSKQSLSARKLWSSSNKAAHDWHSGTLLLKRWSQLPDAETKISLRLVRKWVNS